MKSNEQPHTPQPEFMNLKEALANPIQVWSRAGVFEKHGKATIKSRSSQGQLPAAVPDESLPRFIKDSMSITLTAKIENIVLDSFNQFIEQKVQKD